MFRNKNFILLLISFTCILGYFNLYGTILNELFTKYSLSEKEMSLIGGFANCLALIGVLLISALIDKYKKYRISFLILNTIGIFSHIGMTLALEYIKNNLFLYITVLCSL
jgi:Na+/melibiose symporter-like transporter